MKLNRTWAMVVAIVMALTLSLSGTLAYLQDTDEDVNVMTLGNVYIEQHEYERDVNADGTFKTDTIDNVTSYVLKDFTQGKGLYPAIIPNGPDFIYDPIPVRMSQVGSYGGASVFNTPNAVDKFVTVENIGKSDAYVRTLVAFEQGSLSVEEFAKLISSEIRADIAGNGDMPWQYGFAGTVEIDNNNYYLYEFIYCGAKITGGYRHENGILPAGDTTYPNLCQVYMAAEATNEDVEALDGNKNGLYDILVLSQAVQAAGFEDAKTALDTAFGAATEENIQAWFGGSVIASAPETGATRPAGYNPVDTNNPNLVSGITVTDASDKTTNLRALYTGDGNKISGDLKVEDCYLDGTYAMNVIGDDSGALTVTNTDLRGWVSYDGFTTATFTNCTFGENTNPEIYNNVRPYSTVTFENCAFDGTTFWLDNLPTDATVTFKNCTMNGVVIDEVEDVTVVYGDSTAIVVDNN